MVAQLLDVPASSKAVVKPLCSGKRFRVMPARGQLWTEPRSLDELVPPDAPVRCYDAIINELDVSALEAYYRGGGPPAFHPRDVLKLLIFAMAEGVRSARALARRCGQDVRFMWLAHGVAFDHELLSDFRVTFAEDLKCLFKQTVILGMEAGLITMRQVSVDGTKIAAHAKRQSCTKEDLEKLLAIFDERVEKLLVEMEALDALEDAEAAAERAAQIPLELADTQRRQERLRVAKAALEAKGWDRISETDLEAPVQKTQDGKRPGYNGQVAVDADSGMVLSQELTDAQNDTQQLPPALAATIENTGFKPDAAAFDGGYQSAEGLEYLQTNAINGYVNQAKVANNGRFGHEAFTYDAEGDLYLCPEGHELRFKRLKDLRYDDCRVYRSSSKCCRQCERRAECLSPKSNSRQLVLAPHSELVSAMRKKIETAEGKAALKRRFGTVEPTFGVMKAILGLRQFLLVGKEKAAAELSLAAISINLRKLVKWATEGGSLSQISQALAEA